MLCLMGFDGLRLSLEGSASENVAEWQYTTTCMTELIDTTEHICLYHIYFQPVKWPRLIAK